MELLAPAVLREGGGGETFRVVFIRAPAILDVGPSVEVLVDFTVLASPEDEDGKTGGPDQQVIVAVRQGNLLATAFHPELTSDTRWHTLFLKMMQSSENPVVKRQKIKVAANSSLWPLAPSKDLPVFIDASFLVFE